MSDFNQNAKHFDSQTIDSPDSRLPANLDSQRIDLQKIETKQGRGVLVSPMYQNCYFPHPHPRFAGDSSSHTPYRRVPRPLYPRGFLLRLPRSRPILVVVVTDLLAASTSPLFLIRVHTSGPVRRPPPLTCSLRRPPARQLTSMAASTAAASVRLPFPLLSTPAARSSTLRFPTHRRWAPPSIAVAAFKKLSEVAPLSIPQEPTQQLADEDTLPAKPGVYGVYDPSGELQFIGISRNVRASVEGHRKKVPAELCASVKVAIADEETPDRTALTNAWKSWMEEHIEATGKAPPGNVAGNYTWVSAPQRPPDLRLTPGRHVQLTVPLEQLIDRLVKENKVVTFIKGSRSAPQCGFSQRVVGILEAQGVDFVSVDVLDEEHNPGLRGTLKTYSNWPTFPQIFVGGELVGGCDIISSMAEKGELAALLQK